jgi:ATP-dependent DNA ligase
LSAIATGFNAGEGSRAATFGSLALALFDASGELRQIGDVGGGFTQADLEALRLLDLPFVLEVQFQAWTGAALRMPVFKGLREDVPLTDCTIERQLPGLGLE